MLFFFCLNDLRVFFLAFYFKAFIFIRFVFGGVDLLLDYLIEQAKLTTTNTLYADYKARDAFYHSGPWRKLRKEMLKRDNRECQVTKSEGDVCMEDLIVHHIKPLEFFPELALEPSNLIVVNKSVHNVIHGLSVPKFNDEWW